MDDLFKISSILEKEPNDLENMNQLKILFNEVQEQIKLEKENRENKIKLKIAKLKEIRKQINDEIILNNNIYLAKSDEYKFPDKLKNYNNFLKEKTEQLNKNEQILTQNKKKLALLIAKKNKYFYELNINLELVNCKKKKLSNSLEITALIEKKKSLIGNKRKNNDKYQKMLEEETKKYHNCIDKLNKEIKIMNYDTEEKSKDISKLLERSIAHIKKLNIESIEYNIKKKEILTLNSRLDKIQKQNTSDLSDTNEIINKTQNEYEIKRLELNQENINENDKIDQVISLIDVKYHELNNYFSEKKDEIELLKKNINECLGEEKTLELKIFSINNQNIVSDIKKYEKKIEKEQNNAAQIFLSYKNIQDNLADDLNCKIHKIDKKLLLLRGELEETKFLEELNNRKKYIIQLLNGNFKR